MANNAGAPMPSFAQIVLMQGYRFAMMHSAWLQEQERQGWPQAVVPIPVVPAEAANQSATILRFPGGGAA